MIDHIIRKRKDTYAVVPEIGVVVKGPITTVYWYSLYSGEIGSSDYNTNDLIDVVIDAPNWAVEEWESRQ